MSRWKKEKKPAPSAFEDTAGQTETFATRNVRLITFLICMAVFLAVFIPVGVIGYSAYQDWFDGKDKLPEITVADVVALSEKNGGIQLSELTVFKGELQETEKDSVYVMEFSNYHLRAVANKESGWVEVFVIYHRENNTSADILKDDLRAYFQSNAK